LLTWSLRQPTPTGFVEERRAQIVRVTKHGQGLRALVEKRQHELELELSALRISAPDKTGNIEAALGAIKALLTGDLDQIPPVVAQELSQWIETSKYLGREAARRQ
jgi:hypothetical protein